MVTTQRHSTACGANFGIVCHRYDALCVPRRVGRNNVSAITVPPGDSRALAAAMRALLDNEELRMRLAEGARKEVSAKYSLNKMVASTLEIYREILDANKISGK